MNLEQRSPTNPDSPNRNVCPVCDGLGWYTEAVDAGDGTPEPVQVQCEDCCGTGERGLE